MFTITNLITLIFAIIFDQLLKKRMRRIYPDLAKKLGYNYSYIDKNESIIPAIRGFKFLLLFEHLKLRDFKISIFAILYLITILKLFFSFLESLKW